MEVTAFSGANLSSQKSFSGVPYYLLGTLEKKGISVNRADIVVDKGIMHNIIWGYNKLITRVYQSIKKTRDYTPYNRFQCGIFYNYIQKKLIYREQKKYSGAGYNLIFDFSTYVPKKENQKNIMLCDWTIEYAIREKDKREPNFFENICIKRQEKVLSTADYIVTLFPEMKIYLEQKYNNVYYLGNGINSPEYDENQNLSKTHFDSRNILFVGGNRYKNEANVMVDTVKRYNFIHEDKIKLNIVGLEENSLDISDENCICYGYLDKDKKDESKLFYSLMRDAKIFCQPTCKVGGVQAIMESLYWQLPVVLCPNNEFLKIFGKDLDFGLYCRGESNYICDNIDIIMKMDYDAYERMCISGYEFIKDSTWNSYCDRFIDMLCTK